MKRQFEDEFMDLQAGWVSLCLELYGEHPGDIIYIYISNEKSAIMFNSFIRRGGQIKLPNELGFDWSLTREFLALGTGDIKKLRAVCKEYDRPAPYEMKLRYDVSKGSLDADYKYTPQCPTESDLMPEDIFENWIEEEKKALA